MTVYVSVSVGVSVGAGVIVSASASVILMVSVSKPFIYQARESSLVPEKFLMVQLLQKL